MPSFLKLPFNNKRSKSNTSINNNDRSQLQSTSPPLPPLPTSIVTPFQTSTQDLAFSTSIPPVTPEIGLIRPRPTYGTTPSNNDTNHNQIPYPTPPESSLTSNFNLAPITNTRLIDSYSPLNNYDNINDNIDHGSDRYDESDLNPFTSNLNKNTTTLNSVEDFSAEFSEGKMSIGIDFGTTFSGVAYGSNRLMQGQVKQILSWPGTYETYRKVPSCVLYLQRSPNEEAQILSWGVEAKSSAVVEGLFKVEYFKLFLDPNVIRDGRNASLARLPDLPEGKTPFDVIVDYLGCLWKYSKEVIKDEMGNVADLESADVILTVPSEWDSKGCSLMREAAIKAGLVQPSFRRGRVDKNWRDRLRIITEPEAAAIHASFSPSLNQLKPSQCFIIVDAGGGTVDLATYKLLGKLSQLEMAEMSVRMGGNCGSLFLDLRFEALIRSILKNHPIHLDPPSLAAFRHAFAETDKVAYLGEEDDDVLFRFNCFNIEDNYDPLIGLEYGELAIPGSILRRDVFDPVIDEVLELIESQLAKTPNQKISALILVGGFSGSNYLMNRVRSTFSSRIDIIGRPMDCDVATLQGAARYGLAGKSTVSSVICPRSYIMKVKLPAEPQDKYQRPAYISINNAKIEVCANRLSYLAAKGAVLLKGQRLRSRFCKYSKTSTDCLFTAMLYVSDSDKIYRYTDEGEITELAKWTVDLSLLNSFHFNAANHPEGFYTEFDLGLELDSAEVRGVLLNDAGEECGRATFEFIGN